MAVKLGTISSEGKADVYSYAEDDMVEDPYLKKHLAHFGITMEGMKKVCIYFCNHVFYDSIAFMIYIDRQIHG